jgi:hypothetical protein
VSRAVARAIRRLILAAAPLLAVACGGSRSYIADNERLLGSLPLPSGANVVRTTSAPYYPEGGAGGDPLGFTTEAQIETDGHPTPRSLVAFYRSSLSGWKCRRVARIVPPVLVCQREHDYVNVDLGNLVGAPPSYEVTVDSHQGESTG